MASNLSEWALSRRHPEPECATISSTSRPFSASADHEKDDRKSENRIRSRQEAMDRYEFLEKIGEGSFGTVSRARHKESQREFAIKCMKSTYGDWSAVAQQREIQAISLLCRDCKHLVYVYAIAREKDSRLYFVCELMVDGDLKDFLADCKRKGTFVKPEIIRSMMHQILSGLHHIHSKGYMHRDLKPENLLMSGGNCKVADFSLARPAMVGESERLMTTYVSSRWYRAPELVLEAKTYSTAIDVFALGCVMAEMFSLRPLFPGTDEHDQLPVILELLGPMTEREWPEGIRLVKELQITIPPKAQPADITMPIPHRLANKLNLADASTISLLDNLLKLNPRDRPSVDVALGHAYFLHRPPGATPNATMTPEQQRPVFAAAFDVLPADETPYQKTPRMTTTFSAQHNHPQLVSISPTARHTSSFWKEEVEFPGQAKLELAYAFQQRTAGIMTTSSLTPPAPPFMAHGASLLSGHMRVEPGFRPSHAFDIE